MSNYLILTEKPSASANFVKALGGKAGIFNDFNYKITNLEHIFPNFLPFVIIKKNNKKQRKNDMLP